MLLLTRMNRIQEINGEELLARAEAGVPTTALADAAAARRLHRLIHAEDRGRHT